MIRKECFTTEWIGRVSSELHYNDKNLIEKVIRALSLLEMLVGAGCPLVFKGGTALMLILGKSAHRLSIDIDIISPPGTNVEEYLQSFPDFGFTGLEIVERKQRSDTSIPKSHSKMFYQIAYKSDTSLHKPFERLQAWNYRIARWGTNCLRYSKIFAQPRSVSLHAARKEMGISICCWMVLCG